MAMRAIPAILLAGTLVGPGCERPSREAPPAPAAAEPRASLSARGDMRDHYSAALAAHAAVIRGDLPTARRAATWVVENPVPPSVASWEPALIRQWEQHAQPMREQAQHIVMAAGIDGAAMAAARLGTTCGACHEAMRAVPAFPEVPRPADASGAPLRMRLHAWAAERMWDGLIGPADGSWRQGVESLEVAPLAEDEILSGATAIPEIVERARKVRAHAASASISAPPSIRAAVYGEFLGNCAGCHDRLKVAVPGL
jgi:cytochrome c553